MKHDLDLIRRSLHGRGLRMTAERRAIVKEIRSTEGHFDAEGLVARLERNETKVSRATVYRTVACLVEVGLLRRYDHRDRPAEYESTLWREHHEHMICVACGEVVEFVEEHIEKLQDEVCRRHGFRPLRHTLQIHGLCADCASRADVSNTTEAPPLGMRRQARG